MREQPELVVPATEDGVGVVYMPTNATAVTNESRPTTWQPPEHMPMTTFALRSQAYEPTAAKLAPDLALTLAARTRTRSRESKPQGSRTRSAATSRDGPLPSSDDDPCEHDVVLAGRRQ
jgi:hypothetical protein